MEMARNRYGYQSFSPRSPTVSLLRSDIIPQEIPAEISINNDRIVRVTPDCENPTLVREGKAVQMGLASTEATPEQNRESSPVPLLMAVDA